MNLFWGLFLAALTGILILIVGIVMKFKFPHEINGISGYRSTRSMQNQETWIEAQNFSNKIMRFLGIIAAIVGSCIYLIFRNDAALFIAIGVSIIIVILVIPITESHLKKKFNDKK